MLSFAFFWILTSLFELTNGNNYLYDVGIFHNFAIHLLNFISLLLFFQLFAKCCWFNRLRDVFWWMVAVYITFTFFSTLLSSSTNVNFLNPSLYQQECSFTNVSLLLGMNPVSLYIRR